MFCAMKKEIGAKLPVVSTKTDQTSLPVGFFGIFQRARKGKSVVFLVPRAGLKKHFLARTKPATPSHALGGQTVKKSATS